ncbi:GNAT family N-acetyltransferase [Rhizobium sp. BK251]|uniref:GNAT family N-acetyltransferase n=1 Tax=Rhizobium sp. BK251 TaxID=2512125 RepID=UPI00104B038B|nr:GNAT family N-acetyltransferase [Rhizobium sp. BK251]TCL68139.1 acetyltransferase (GNAT) family protein [Rhizobium sp. BK251]
MLLVPATTADIGDIVELVNKAYRDENPKGGWTDERELLAGPRIGEERLADMIAHENCVVLLCRRYEDAKLIGCVAVKEMEHGMWHLSLLAVDPALQAAGLGRAILTAAEKYVLEREGRSIQITVIGLRKSLLEWYVRRGYAQTGVIEVFPYDDESVGTPLRQDLSLIVLRKSLDRPTSLRSRETYF